MINKVSSRIIVKNTSPFFDSNHYLPSNKIGAILNDNVIKVNKGSALDQFINEREEIRKKIKELSVKANIQDQDVQKKPENSEMNSNETENLEKNTKNQLEEKLKKVDDLITGYEKGFLINSTDDVIESKNEGMSMLA